MEPEGSIPHSQMPVTRPYPEPARSSPYPQILLPYSPIYARVSQCALFPSVFSNNNNNNNNTKHNKYNKHATTNPISLSLVTEAKKKDLPEDGQKLTETCWRILRLLKQCDYINVLF